MIRNEKYVADGFTTLLGGVDESRAPLLLRADQVSRAVNITFRDGFPRTRPPYIKRNLKFERGSYGFWFINHLYQGSEYYDDFQAMEKVVVSVGGRIFLVNPTNGFMVTDITPRKTTFTTVAFTSDTTGQITVTVSDASLIFPDYPIYINGDEYFVDSKSGNVLTVTNSEAVDGTLVASGAVVEYLDPNHPNLPIAWFVQAEQYMVIQNGLNRPIIYDGAGTRRSNSPTELPVGSAMAYGNGRVWIAVNGGRQFVAGDIAGGPTGVLGFTENSYLAGGGSFRIPANVGIIRAMKFVMNLDTSLGQGPLQVLCERAIFSVNAPTIRELWSEVTNPIQTVSLINFGATSQASTALINGDLFFRAEDGLRSFIIARRDFGMWGNTPISQEMGRILDQDTPELLQYSSAVLFDNRLLFTAVPLPGPNGVRHKALISLDFDLISTIQEKSPPAYDGFWTGIDVTGLVAGRFAGRNRCFAFVHDADGHNDFWELAKAGRNDSGINQIDWVLETRSLSFPRQGGMSGLKRIEGGEVWLSQFSDEVTMTLQYRPDQYECWQEWASKTICITADQCDETDACDGTTSGNMLGFKTRLSFGKPAEWNDLADEKAGRAAFNYQVRVSGTGYVVLNRFIVHAHEEEEWAISPPSDDRTECSTIACCPPDPFQYRSMCGVPQVPVLMNQNVGFAFGFRLGFRFEPGSTYTLYGFTEEAGQHAIVEFPNDIFEDWTDPDGWYEFNVIDIVGTFTGLSAGDEIQFWMVQEGCGLTRTTDRVTMIYTG